jgi:mevalonate kinase
MDLAHGLLSGFGIVAPDVDAAVEAARAAGAVGAKMSGAGGAGGAFLALAADRKSAAQIARALEREGWRAWAEGVAAG